MNSFSQQFDSFAEYLSSFPNYAGYIFVSYAVVTLVVTIMVIQVLLTYRARRRALEKLEKAGLRRAAARKKEQSA